MSAIREKRRSDTIADSKVCKKKFIVRIARNVPASIMFFFVKSRNILAIIARKRKSQRNHHSTNCWIYQLSGINFLSISSISFRSLFSRFWTCRYAGPALPSHCHIGFSINLLIHIFILSKCPLVDQARPNNAFIVPEYCIKKAQRRIVTKIKMEINSILYFLYIFGSKKSIINHTHAKNHSKALLEYV